MLDLKNIEKLLKTSVRKTRAGTGLTRIHYQVANDVKENEHFLTNSHWALRLPEPCVPSDFRLGGPGSYDEDRKKTGDTPPDVLNVIPRDLDKLPILVPKMIGNFAMLAGHETVPEPNARDKRIFSVYTRGVGPDTFLDREYLVFIESFFTLREMEWRQKSEKGICVYRALPNDIGEKPETPWDAVLMPTWRDSKKVVE